MPEEVCNDKEVKLVVFLLYQCLVCEGVVEQRGGWSRVIQLASVPCA